MIAGQPVVLVDEEFDMPDGSAYLFDLARSFSPDELFYRDRGRTASADPNIVFSRMLPSGRRARPLPQESQDVVV